jgi:hypothetical protein
MRYSKLSIGKTLFGLRQLIRLPKAAVLFTLKRFYSLLNRFSTRTATTVRTNGILCPCYSTDYTSADKCIRQFTCLFLCRRYLGSTRAFGSSALR